MRADGDAPVVFLTGANGFVGSHLVRALIARGYCVRALIRPQADRSRLEGFAVEWVVGDLDDREALKRGVHGARAVIHNAGRVRAPSPEAYHHANCVGTINLLDAVEESAPRVERLVHISSQAAAGPGRGDRPRHEDDPPAPLTPYGESKLAGEKAVMARAARFPVVSLRPPAVYGPEDTAVLGFFQAVGWHIKPLFGPQPQRMSIVHVEDLVRGALLALETPAVGGEVFNIAEDHQYELAELEDHIQQALGVWAVRVRIPKPLLMTIAWTGDMLGKSFGFVPRLNRDKARDFLQQNWMCSTDKANRLLGYRSQVPFPQGARTTVAWYRDKGWL